MKKENTILEIEDVTLKLGGKRILNGLSMALWEGHIHAIVGPNGAGKSTLASTIMGLSGYRHFSGDIRFQNASIRDLNVHERAKRGMTLAWQEPARYEGLSVTDFILAGARDKKRDRVKTTLEQVGLNPDLYIGRAVDKTLSGGERKRVELASILAMEPRLVIMDEPDSGIDVEALDRIFDAIHILKENGSTVILITHSLAVLQQAEHAFLMCCGRLLDKGGIHKIESFFKGKCVPCDHKNRPAREEFHG